jgi:hypothetical protein
MLACYEEEFDIAFLPSSAEEQLGWVFALRRMYGHPTDAWFVPSIVQLQADFY